MGLMLKELGKVTRSLTYSARKQPSGLFRECAGAGTDAARGGTLGISHRSWLKSAQASRGDDLGPDAVLAIQSKQQTCLTRTFYSSSYI